MSEIAAEFRAAYARHRAAEGRGYAGPALLSLPYLTSGPFARQWAVRAKSFDGFMRLIVGPMAQTAGRPLDILDLGAGNSWLSRRVAQQGHRATALDMRDDAVDGLGAAGAFLAEEPSLFARCVASFDDIPAADSSFDIVLFNAALHYARDLPRVLAEAARVTRSGGRLVILDSPFYARDCDGAAMVREKQAQAAQRFGAAATTLLSLQPIEYLTPQRLAAASQGLGLIWSRSRIRYPLWYEARPLLARLKGARRPSRFDLWSARRP